MRLKIRGVSRAVSCTFGTHLLRSAALLAAGAANVVSAAPDTGALISRLARNPPSSIQFTEVRFSSLLVEPLVVSGTLTYEAEGALHRRVEAPYRESTAIRGETVRVEREDEAPRTFALRRAPELRGFLTGMLGMLSGDSSLIDEHFTVVASGDEQRWRLDLEPVDDRLRRYLRNLVVAGGADEPRCFVIVASDGGTSVMLLGAMAALPLGSPIVLAELLGRCAE